MGQDRSLKKMRVCILAPYKVLPTIDGAAIPENRIYGILWGKIQFIGWLIIALTNPIILISVIAVILLVPLMLRRKKKEILENYKS